MPGATWPSEKVPLVDLLAARHADGRARRAGADRHDPRRRRKLRRQRLEVLHDIVDVAVRQNAIPRGHRRAVEPAAHRSGEIVVGRDAAAFGRADLVFAAGEIARPRREICGRRSVTAARAAMALDAVRVVHRLVVLLRGAGLGGRRGRRGPPARAPGLASARTSRRREQPPPQGNRQTCHDPGSYRVSSFMGSEQFCRARRAPSRPHARARPRPAESRARPAG